MPRINALLECVGLAACEKAGKHLARDARFGDILLDLAKATLDYTKTLRVGLPEVFRELGVKLLFDAPCGDFNWMRKVPIPEGFSYLGGDVAPSIIRDARTNHAAANRDFRVFDVAADRFPQADLWFCRDCLFHLPEALVFRALANFARSEIPWAMLTTHRTPPGHLNTDIPPGEFRLLDFFAPPFSLSLLS